VYAHVDSGVAAAVLMNIE